MPPHDLLAMIRHRPFQPFRIHLTDGMVYEIHHPEMVMVGLGSAVIGFPADPQELFYQRTETVALAHVVRLEPLESAFSRP